MKRRTLLQWLASSVAWLPFVRVRLAAQAPTLSPRDVALLNEIGVIVLPSALGRRGATDVVERFVRWHRSYKPGAEMDHGYGFTRLRNTPAHPGVKYPAQLEAIARAAEARGGALGTLPPDAQRAVIESAIAEVNVQRLSARPSGAHVVTDLMGFYFGSSEAEDLCYGVAIGRDTCRGLPGSDQPPAKLGSR